MRVNIGKPPVKLVMFEPDSFIRFWFSALMIMHMALISSGVGSRCYSCFGLVSTLVMFGFISTV